MKVNIFAYRREEISEQYALDVARSEKTRDNAAFARTQGIPAPRNLVTRYYYELGEQEPVKSGDKRTLIPDRNGEKDLDLFSKQLENLLGQEITLKGKRAEKIDGFTSIKPKGILYNDARHLYAQEVCLLSEEVTRVLVL